MTDLPVLKIGCSITLHGRVRCGEKPLTQPLEFCQDCREVRRVVLTRAAHWQKELQKRKNNILREDFTLGVCFHKDVQTAILETARYITLESAGLKYDDLVVWLREQKQGEGEE